MKKYESLTKYIPEIQEGTFGSLKAETEYDKSDEYPTQMTHVSFSKTINDFSSDIFQFSDDNPDLKLNDYYQFLSEKTPSDISRSGMNRKISYKVN